MRVAVDKSRCQGKTAGVDNGICLQMATIAQGCNSIPVDSDIDKPGLAATAVYDSGPGKYKITACHILVTVIRYRAGFKGQVETSSLVLPDPKPEIWNLNALIYGQARCGRYSERD